MTRIPTRLRALAITSLAAVVLLTALSAEATLATDPIPGTTPSMAPIADPTPAPSPTMDPIPSPTPDPSATADPAATVPPDVTPQPDPGASPATAPAPDPAPAAAPVAVPAPPTLVSTAAVVTAYARSHLRARYRHGSTGPRAFDCSGLMWRVFHEAGLGRKVTSTSARAIYTAYVRRGLASRRNPQVGDLVIWGRGSHVGLYIGHGYAISALTQGVRVHRVGAVFTPFTAYLHTHLAGLETPVWRLLVASHIRSLRHAVKAATLRAGPSTSATANVTLRSRTKLVLLSSARDASGHRWFRVVTLGGRIGWLPAGIVRR